MDRVKNPQGRPDWLAAKLLERVIGQSSDQRLKFVHSAVKNELETLLLKTIGPRTKRGRQVKELLEKGKALVREIQAA
jgi:hypothetical protein